MIIQKVAPFFMLLLLCACNTSTDKSVKDSTQTQQTDTTRVKDSTLNYKIDTSRQVNTLLIRRDTILTADINNNKATVHAFLSGIGKHVTIVVPVKSGDSLTASIITDVSTANVRFNQIYIPSGREGKYDGPFSRKISYPISVKGNYRLIVGEDLMAGIDWKGSFTCNIFIKGK